jgi:hypothetical protein
MKRFEVVYTQEPLAYWKTIPRYSVQIEDWAPDDDDVELAFN